MRQAARLLSLAVAGVRLTQILTFCNQLAGDRNVTLLIRILTSRLSFSLARIAMTATKPMNEIEPLVRR